MDKYKLILINGDEIDLGSRYCTYLSVSQYGSSMNSRNQNCNILEVMADHNTDHTFIEVGNKLIPIRSILYVQKYKEINYEI